jgi:hypothetical protein
MTATCPNGHVSATDDYCDQCGVPISAAPTPSAEHMSVAPSGEAPAAPSTEAPAAPPGEPCPQCGTARHGDDRYCEACGHDFESPPPGTALWQAVTSADRAQFDRLASDGVSFPDSYAERRFPLTADYVRIGRNHGQTPGDAVEMNLAGAPEDPAISHVHAVLERQSDGSYTVRDLGSMNGTTVNDDPTPVSADASTAVPLAEGDQIHIGAWTTITLRHT